MSISRYFGEMLDPGMKWDDVAAMAAEWGGAALSDRQGVAAGCAAGIGCAGIVLSNHRRRQRDGSRAPGDQFADLSRTNLRPR
jgi:L-lactate dehydrogenase (cytochrome)